MDSQLSILAICNYPSDSNPAYQVFVRALLLEMKSLGAEITVLAAENLANLAKKETGLRLAPRSEVRDGLRVLRPRGLSFSTLSLPLGIHTLRWSTAVHKWIVVREAGNLDRSFDMCMGYFLYPHGASAALVADKLGIPSVVLLGESDFGRYEMAYTGRDIGQLLKRFAGVVSNSSLITELCIERYGLSGSKVRTFPNGVDGERFYPHDRAEARRHCGLPANRPIIVFVGNFIKRKGPLKVLKAIKSRPEIGAVFLGSGLRVPRGRQVLFQGRVTHEEVPIWLSAADLFVLPTLNEGCSNAILEALSCGLPVISSDLPFNDGILDEQVGILVDPCNVEELGRAIFSLIDDPERRDAMSQAALRRAQSFRLTERATRILEFLKTLQKKS